MTVFVFYFFAAILVWLSFKSFRGGITYLRFFRQELAKPRSEYTPFVTVIAPCRGLDDGFRENLTAILEQDYPDYEIVFVVDSKEDASVPVIESIIAGSGVDGISKSTKLIIAPKAEGCAQKIANLREAVLHADDRSQAYVFVDSDARPASDWLRVLLAPLEDANVGAATGYRWYISERPNFSSEMRSVWNASIASALGPNTRANFTWGGSTAIRRDVFERIKMREKWAGTLSDDFAVTRALNSAGLPIVFVPQALTASIENTTLGEMLEFTTRQMKITRVYMTRLWIVSLVGSVIFNAVMITAFLIALLSKTNTLAVAVSIFTLVSVVAFSIGKAWLRLYAVRLVLTKYDKELKNQVLSQCTLWLLGPAVFLFNGLAAWASRRLKWRGITYELKSPTETVIISHTHDGI